MAELRKLGRYELRRVLGKGAMGVVYEGFDPTLGRQVAIKTILQSAAFDEETERNYAERFVREAKAVARLNHPNIVQVHDFGVENEVAYLVMEFIRGRELRGYFEARERFEVAESVRIMGELLDALEFAHEAGVIHRDVKPANVMLDAQRRVKLADFGVARVQDSDRSAAGTMVGTPAFMSPEQISGGKIDRRTDLFSAGTILYQLLTGEQPFQGEGAWTVAKKIMQDDPPNPSSVVKSVSPAYDAIVSKALAKKQHERFASAKEFSVALRSALGGAAAIVPPDPAAAKTPAEVRASETELEFWRSIQGSDDPHEFEFYLQQFPQGAYAVLARHKIAKLREPLDASRKAAEEQARRESEERARRESEERARREAEEQARAAARAKAEVEARARLALAEENARREAAEKAKRAAEERARQAAALAKLKREEEPSKSAEDPEATVAMGKKAAAGVAAAPAKKSIVLPAAVAILLVAAIGAYLQWGRSPVPVSEVAKVTAPAKAEVSAADIEKIRKETEERIRREYADKSAAEQAAAAKAATEKAVQEKQALVKAAADKAALEKAAADKMAAEKAAAERQLSEKLAAAKSSAERVALEKAAAERAAAEKLAAEKAAAEKAAAEKAAAERAEAEKVAAAKAAAAKAAAAAKPGWPSVGDRWVYEVREVDVGRRYSLSAEVLAISPSQVRDIVRAEGVGAIEMSHQANPVLAPAAPGIASFWTYLRAFREPRAGERFPDVEMRQLWQCSSVFGCSAEARVVGLEKINVRAGSFEAWKIVVELKIQGSILPGRGELVYWYSEAAKRIVKYQSRVRMSGSRDLWLQPNVDMELVSYTPAASSR